MDNKKKTRLFVRVLCALLCVIMILSFILPAAYATEIEENEPPFLNGEGFEYIENEGEWYLNVTEDKPVVRLTNVPESFTRDNLPVLIANVDTFEVHILNLLEIYGYAAMLDIEEGYYLVVANNYCWADKNDEHWAINDAQTLYFHYGESETFDAHKYDLNFEQEDNIIDLPLTLYTKDNLPVVRASGAFHLEEMDAIYPLDELHNMDEIVARMQHIDIMQSLELGYTVYVDGYVPNSPEYYTSNTNQTSSVGDTPSTPNLDNLAAAGAQPPAETETNSDDNTSTTPNTEAPIATPEMQETKPLPEVEIQNPSGEQPTDEKQNPIEMVGDKVGIDTSVPTFKESIMGLLDGIWVYILLLAVVGGIYFYIQKKKIEVVQEREETDRYDDSRIE